MQLIPYFMALLFLTMGMTYHAGAAEWQTLKDGSHRIDAPESDEPEPEKITELPLPEGHYEPGQGTIDGAFGILFGQPIENTWTQKSLGWTTPPSLPEGLEYRGIVKLSKAC